MCALRLSLVSDFNAVPLARFLTTLSAGRLQVDVTPYGQVYQSLAADVDEPAGWGGIVWTLAERIIPSFARALHLEHVEPSLCLTEVDAFADTLADFAARHQHSFMASWTMPPAFRGYGMLDWRPRLGLMHLLAQMNLRLADRLAEMPNTYLLDAGRWLASTPKALAPRMWYAAKVPYSSQVFEQAARDLMVAIGGISGTSRRLIVLDLDDTLWSGIIGETGWEGIRLGGHDYVGEAFRDFQAALAALSNRGIQLAIASKNDESVALEALDRHPEMLLRRKHFAGWRIDWHDKATNIEALAAELNLALSSIVFIDNNPAERDRVRRALPDVLVPEWPSDPAEYVVALHALDCFETASLTAEDRGRTSMYVAERSRREVKLTTESTEIWLNHLATHLQIARATKSNIARVAQLFNKTNQLNLSTRRLGETEILAWADAPGHSLLTVSVSDKFGDMGLVGVISIEVTAARGYLIDFILSCRVMGRRVEESLLHLAAAEAARLGGSEMEARYLPTARNRPTLDVFRGAGLPEPEEYHFLIDCRMGIPKPGAVAIEFDEDVETLT